MTRRSTVLGLAVATLCVAAATVSARAAEERRPAPDFDLFKARVEPVLQAVCAQCHAGKGKGRLALIVHAPGAPFPEHEHRKNYETVLALVEPGNPDRSPFLQKPLAGSVDGVKHEGGDRIFRGTSAYRAWVDFINGVRLDPATLAASASVAPAPPASSLDERGAVLAARGMERVGDLVDATVGEGRRAAEGVAPGPAGGVLRARVRAGRAGLYAVSLRASGAGRSAALRLGPGEPLTVRATSDAPADVSPEVPCDGGRPIDVRAGAVRLADGAIALEGRPVRFLSPADVPHSRVEATLAPVAPDARALLLFDLRDAQNGKYAGLVPGGRFEMGVFERGRARALASREVPAGAARERVAVEYVSGLAVARLDGKPLLHVNFDRALGAGRFGFEAEGEVVLRALAAGTREAPDAAHRSRFTTEGVVALPAGDHALEVSLPPGGATLHSVTIRELAR